MSDYLSASQLAKNFGYLYAEEIEYLKDLSKMLDYGPTIVNIGAGAGTSTLTFLESRDDCSVISVDKQKYSSPFGSSEGEMNAIIQSSFNGTIRLKQVEGDSVEVGKKLFIEEPKFCADLIFVDGDHSFEGCSGDIISWLPFLLNNNIYKTRKSIMAFHDYEDCVWKADVQRAVHSNMKGYKKLKVIGTVVAYVIE